MGKGKVKAALRFLSSSRGTALPVSFLMLFVSLTMIISATYYVSVTKIEARGRILNVAVAKQNMLYLADAAESTVWSPGSSTAYSFEDSGGTFKTYPTAESLLVNVTDNVAFYTVMFNSSIGKAVYELPSSEAAVYTFYLRGDNRAIINQSAFTTTLLYLSPGTPSPELTLKYRPLATISETGFTEGKPVNTLRVYIVNLNTSASITAQGEFSIRTTCINVISSLQTYNFSYPVTALTIKTDFEGRIDTVVVPVESNMDGAFVKIETLVCNVKLERIQGA